MLLTIALDGPVGAGKSSVADGVAQKLGILHLDTGAMYRAFAWKALQKGVALEDEAALEALTATDLPEVRYENGVFSINGLYRHGFLLAPALAELTLAYVERGAIDNEVMQWS